MSTFDVNNQYSGTYFGKDRLGFTTPNPDGTELERPFLTVPYPAPWLPGRRRDEGHPVGAQVVISDGYLLGQDKSGALVPAGLRSGKTGPGGDYMAVIYSQDDAGMAFNGATGNLVAAANEAFLLACPDEAGTQLNGGNTTCTVAADKLNEITLSATTGVSVGTYLKVTGLAGVHRVTALNTSTKVATVDVAFAGAVVAGTAIDYGTPTINGYTPSAGDIAFAKTCDLIPGGTSRPVGFAIRNVFQYLGGVDVISTVGGMKSKLNGVIPAKFRVHNYMHEPGTAIATRFGLRVPYIGADLNTLNAKATEAGLTVPADYAYDDFSRSFVHCVGTLGNSAGNLFSGCSIVADDQNNMIGSGHFRPYDSTKHSFDQICGRVIGIEQIYPIKDYADRVRTQFDRAQGFVGPFADRNPVTQMMGGSATRGLDYAVNLATKGLLRKLLEKGVTPTSIPVECGTYIWIAVNTII